MHQLVAAYLGYKPPVQTSAQPVQDIEDLFHLLGDIPIKHVPPIDTSAFDAAFKESPHG